jgi:pyruvate kinase
MKLPLHKTKIVCTIGPASESPEMMEQMIGAGMNVARLNFSHGDFDGHKKIIERLRSAAKATGQRVAIMADLPGPKMRIGQLALEPVELIPGDSFTLTRQQILGDAQRVSVTFDRIAQVVKAGDILFLNDGLIQLEVKAVEGDDVRCIVSVGGELRSRKGLNLPGIDLGMSAFTERDRECLKFALEHGVDAISQSFVESGADIAHVRRAATSLGYDPFIIAKIERSGALDHIDDILREADGIMIARGDLGVEIPIETIAIVQKQLARRANFLGKPIITATQMLESMTTNRRPTRAEATDVANAILDGTDCVMLSGESAMGDYPVEAVAMLAKIAEATEPHRPGHYVRETLEGIEENGGLSTADLIALSVETTLGRISPAAVFVPTRSGKTARSLARFRPRVWIVAVSSLETTCQRLAFTYGCHPTCETDHPEDWNSYVRQWLRHREVDGNLVLLTEGPSDKHPEANHRMEIIDLDASCRGR